jgi:hypothetical protein
MASNVRTNLTDLPAAGNGAVSGSGLAALKAALAGASITPSGQDGYPVFASNYKPSTRPGSLIASVVLNIPAFDLHLVCQVRRDRQGNTYVSMPRVKVEAPDGKIHHKTLARWGSASSEQRFQRAALAAIGELLSKSRPASAKDRGPYLTAARFAPLSRPAPRLAVLRITRTE